MELKILKRKIVKQGNSRYFYIPLTYFRNAQLNDDQSYDIIILIPSKSKKIGDEKNVAH
jgi:antitoxin component of MazEF toxin-antitoxin module